MGTFHLYHSISDTTIHNGRETITVIVADHGEHLGEYGGLWGHGKTLYR